jgi:hypothetical protein
MARTPKGVEPPRPQPAGKDESWESIEEGWTNPRDPDHRDRGDPSGLPTLEMEGKPKAKPDPERPLPSLGADEDDEALESQITQVDPLAPLDERQLPVAPPGHRRVAKTIVGVGTADLQALMKAEQVVRGGPAKLLESSAGRARVFAAPPPEELATVRTPTPEGIAAPRTPSDEIATVVRHEMPERLAPVQTESTPIGRTDPLPTVPQTDPLPTVDAQTNPMSISDSFPALTPTPVVQPKQDPSRPAPSVRPLSVSGPRSVVSSRFRPPETSRVDHGPSNFTLALLWAVAIASVGLAIFLYATR